MQFAFRFSRDYTPYLVLLLGLSGWSFRKPLVQALIGASVLVNTWGELAFRGHSELVRRLGPRGDVLRVDFPGGRPHREGRGGDRTSEAVAHPRGQRAGPRPRAERDPRRGADHAHEDRRGLQPGRGADGRRTVRAPDRERL